MRDAKDGRGIVMLYQPLPEPYVDIKKEKQCEQKIVCKYQTYTKALAATHLHTFLSNYKR